MWVEDDGGGGFELLRFKVLKLDYMRPYSGLVIRGGEDRLTTKVKYRITNQDQLVWLTSAEKYFQPVLWIYCGKN